MPTHVKEFEIEASECEVDFDNASGFDTSAQNVLFCGLVVGLGQAVEIIKETVSEIEIIRLKKVFSMFSTNLIKSQK